MKAISLTFIEHGALQRVPEGITLRRGMGFPLQLAAGRVIQDHHELTRMYSACSMDTEKQNFYTALAHSHPTLRVGEQVMLLFPQAEGHEVLEGVWRIVGIDAQHVLSASINDIRAEGFEPETWNSLLWRTSIKERFQLMWGQANWTWRIEIEAVPDPAREALQEIATGLERWLGDYGDHGNKIVSMLTMARAALDDWAAEEAEEAEEHE